LFNFRRDLDILLALTVEKKTVRLRKKTTYYVAIFGYVNEAVLC